jgi:hypothetical protein
MHPAFRFVVAALAAWRLSFLLAREDGPGRVFVRLRAALARGPLAGGAGCVKCVSVWVALPLAFFVGGTWAELAVTWLALSGVAALVDEWTRPPFEWRDAAEEAKSDELLRTKSNGAPD